MTKTCIGALAALLASAGVGCAFDSESAGPALVFDPDPGPGEPGTDTGGDPDISVPTVQTSTFKNGVDNYIGNVDTFIDEDQPDDIFGYNTFAKWDLDSSGLEVTLLRFDEIVGDEGSQIPSQATIVSATLSLVIQPGKPEAVRQPGTLHEIRGTWGADTTWHSFTQSELGNTLDQRFVAASMADLPFEPGVGNIDVTSSLQRWAQGQTENHGWIFLPGNDITVPFFSGDASEVEHRPTLVVEWFVQEPSQ